MAKKNFNAWELQQKVNEVDNKAEQTYVDEKVNTINTNINTINSSLEENTQQLDSRLVVQENKKISETDLTETLLAQITGTAPISGTVADYSLINRKFALPVMIGIKSRNLFDVTDITDGKFILNTNGVETTGTSYCCSNYIPVTPGLPIRISGTKEQGAFYDADKNYVSGYVYANEVTTVPNDCYYIRLSMKKAETSTVQLEYGDVATEYTSYNPKLDINCIEGKLPLEKLDESIITGVIGYNLFNKAIAEYGKYISYTTGIMGTLANYYASDYIEVEEGERYTLSGTKEQLAFYDENKVYVSGIQYGNELTTIPTGVKYVRLTIKASEIDSVQFQKGEATSYEMYGKKLSNESFSLKNLNFLYENLGLAPRIITVKKDGTGDFTSLVKAVNSITITNALNRYEIQVYSGEYDIIDELGGDTYLSSVETNTSANQGLKLPSYVNLIGIGNVTLKGEIADDKATVNNTTRVSTLNFNKTNKIKNIKITAKNMRYAIHSETNGDFENADIELENVQAIHQGNTDTTNHWKWCCGFGMGFGGNGKYKFKNCLFETKSEIYGNGGFICHNWNNQSSGSILDFEYCEFTNTTTGDIGFRYGSMDNTYTDIFNFKGCQFNGKLKIKEESTGAGINAGFYGYGNSEITTDIAGGLTPTVRLL